MEWIKLTEDNIPEGTVLCANFNKGTYGYKEKIIGIISYHGSNYYQAESECEILENATHFIDINKLDIE